MSDSGEAFDAVLFLSFGGPNGPEDVMPFLENVTRGRGVPPERLEAVAEHYLHFGGVSPINRLNLEMIDALRAVFTARGIGLPVYFGNRNWHPLAEDTVEKIYRDGHRRVLVFPTSAWAGYSGCRQYHEDIARALAALGQRVPASIDDDPILLRKIPQYWDAEAMIAAAADAIGRARGELSAADVAPRLVFTAHSIPLSADRAAGPAADGGGLYSRQVAAAAHAVATRAGYRDFDQVWQSRSGPPQVPWLEPDICDHLESLRAQGVRQVVVQPVGFVSDHLEVVWDLDNEAAEKARELGLDYVRADTVGTDPRFIEMIADLVADYADGGGDLTALGCADNGRTCRSECCVPVSRPSAAPGAVEPTSAGDTRRSPD
ncbi:MAG: ferrochelatase [Gordonia sp.]|uniref:ferrochelatase n=1 Tax=Gordonia sp. (in: high G+C Gram-positive bacteria) TaxID=84139 RepID=UPI000C4B7030|nr:ferrochelatase [Gordonia sp. (in: high G+C Gram-positive bacteria)]MAU82803.1 ferrochelatase [Gordonia sp. (in: high G+C Gram-positive bacteria)]